MVFTDQALRHLINEVGVQQVVYGTDIPFSWPDTLDVILNASYLSNSDQEAILGGNVMKLLRIPTRPGGPYAPIEDAILSNTVRR
jgi:predicted TIM-barrel fold metal-dependent hydrolase